MSTERRGCQPEHATTTRQSATRNAPRPAGPSPICQRDLDDAYLANAIVDAHRDDPEFEYQFLVDELERAGHQAGKRCVWWLCSEHRIWSTTTKEGRIGKGRPGPAVHDDLVARNFTADHPAQIWLTDITEPLPVGQSSRPRCARPPLLCPTCPGPSPVH